MPPTSSSPKLKAVKNILLLFAGILLTGITVHALTSYLQVKKIRLEGVNKGRTVYGLDNAYDNPMLFLNEKKLSELIKKNNPAIAAVQIVKHYPDMLHLKITYYKPAVYLAADEGYLLLSEDGRVLERTREGSLLDIPIIRYYEKISYRSTQPGSFLPMRDILTAVYFAGKVQGLGFHVITIDIDGVDMIGLNLDGKAIDFSSEKDRELQVYQMEQIIHQFRIEGKNFRKMDLRFNQPILELTQ